MCGNGVLLILNILSYTPKTPLLCGNVSVRASISVGSVGKKYVVPTVRDPWTGGSERVRLSMSNSNAGSIFAARYALIIVGGW
jgi:hypothetical protein